MKKIGLFLIGVLKPLYWEHEPIISFNRLKKMLYLSRLIILIGSLCTTGNIKIGPISLIR
ncbi:hypothetical protein SAMN05661044_01045 [Olivibacter domesticus]|uniref:Uncharacterized protein n=1 Tax=Olivibacter domesticus TaxID=407022 RepID=A0A1H7JNC7_OLID1|nr:hypothetical protein SAMN05661044_01045 [Olivibacter domesticus]